ncbi:MAG: hypothetical protein HOP29_12350 [Phycisphaerales bacterium]|nr:hypothetical protein [Phycisphaerales bacterium]
MSSRRVLVSAVFGLVALANVGRAQEPNDDFDDGVIDPLMWSWGWDRTGIGGPGAGSWQGSHDEIIAADGYLRIRVFGPTSGNTFGGWAWLQSQYDYNDGFNHVINFR